MASGLKLPDRRVRACQSLDAVPGVLRSAGHTSELCPQKGFASNAPSSFAQTEEESCWGEHWCMGIWP